MLDGIKQKNFKLDSKSIVSQKKELQSKKGGFCDYSVLKLISSNQATNHILEENYLSSKTKQS